MDGYVADAAKVLIVAQIVDAPVRAIVVEWSQKYDWRPTVGGELFSSVRSGGEQSRER